MIIRTVIAAGAIALAATAASAGTKYGTANEAEALADQLISIIDAGGVSAGIDAVYDPNGPFQATPMGVQIFEDSVVLADSRDPNVDRISYEGHSDLNGIDFWEGMVAAANGSRNFETRWYDFEGEAQEYTYNCHSEWQTEGAVMVWICR